MSRVGLLIGTTIAWFAQLLEKISLILDSFDEFIEEFETCFGDMDSVRSVTNRFENCDKEIAQPRHMHLIFAFLHVASFGMKMP